MSGLSIDHGGAIAVDPAELRLVGRRLDAVATRYDEAERRIGSAYRLIVDTPGLSTHVDIVALWAVGARMAGLRDRCRDDAESTLLMADVYEYVELKVEAQLAGSSDAGDDARDRMRTLEASDDRIPEMAEELITQWERERFEGLGKQLPLGGVLGPLGIIPALFGVMSGRGVIPRGTVLRGTAEAVSVAPVQTSTPAAAPSGLAGALQRLPVKGGAQVAVEKYSYADGTSRYVVYIMGTQTFAPGDMGGREPWDMKSNTELYAGRNAASYEATIAAIESAGAEPGDRVDVVGHSQGGLIAAYVAMQSDYDVGVTILAGSPGDPMLDEDQMLVSLGNTDDAVRGFAAGGSPGGSGSPDSLAITREDDPVLHLGDAGEPHLLESYIDLARAADESDDPRIEKLDDLWQRLDEAEVVERTEYRAERVEPAE